MVMELEKLKIIDSSHIGIHVALGNKFAIVPEEIKSNQLKTIENILKVKCIKYNIAGSNINGVLCKIIDNKIILSKASEKKDVEFFKKQGFEVLVLNSFYAIGNLIANLNNKIIISTEFDEKTTEKIKDFLGVKIEKFILSDILTIGTCVIANKNGFAISPIASEKEILYFEKLLKVKGNIATVNYGDGFIGNGLLVNDSGVLVGENTTGYELIRINDIFFE